MAVDIAWLGTEVLGRQLNEEETSLLASRVHEKSCSAGEKIITYGHPGGVLHILRSGKASVDIRDDDDSQMSVADVNPADLFGELTFLNNKPATADVVATEDCVVYTLSRDDLTNVIEHEQPQLAYLFFSAILEHQKGVIMEQRVTLAPELRKAKSGGMSASTVVILAALVAIVIFILTSS